MSTRQLSALARCLDPDEYATVARFRVFHPDSTFSIEFGAHVDDAPVWNIAKSPPVGAEDFAEWPVRDAGRGYVLVDSTAETAVEAADELDALVAETDATDYELAKTFAGAENPLKDLKDVIQNYVADPLRRVFGGESA